MQFCKDPQKAATCSCEERMTNNCQPYKKHAFYLCELSNETQTIHSTDWFNDGEYWIMTDTEGTSHDPNWRYYPSTCPVAVREITKNLNQHNQFPSWHWNRLPVKYNAEEQFLEKSCWVTEYIMRCLHFPCTDNLKWRYFFQYEDVSWLWLIRPLPPVPRR